MKITIKKREIQLEKRGFKNLFQISFLLLILCIGFSCEDNLGTTLFPPIPPGGNPQPQPLPQLPNPSYLQSSQVRTIFSSQISGQLYGSDPYIGKFENYVYFNYERFLRDELVILQTKLGLSGYNIEQLADQFILNTSNTGTLVLPSQVQGAVGQYSTGQLTIMDSYSTNMYSATSVLDASGYYNTAKTQITNSSLSNNEKIFLMSVIETGNEFAKRFFNGEWNGIYESLKVVSGNQGGCSVNWRGVWAGAVVGGVVNGVRCAVIGASGGTVGLPGFGTVTGGVAGGVFGFAGGFLLGAAEGVAADLLTSCFRRSYSTQPVSFSDCMRNGGSFQTCGGPNIPVSLNFQNEVSDNKIWFIL